MNNASVFIIIPNWNGLKHLTYSLQSLAGTTYPNYQAVLVDDGSTDGSIDFVKSNYPFIKIIKNKINKGFAGAVNEGIKYALDNGADYVAVFNSDIRVIPGWIEPAIDILLKKTDSGLVGYTEIPPEREELFYGRVDVQRNAENKEVKGLRGCLFICPTEVFRNIGLLDEDYYMYGEDNDFFLRLQWAGYKMQQLNIPVWHFSEGSRIGKLSATWLIYRNSIRYAIKNENLIRLFRMVLALMYHGCNPFMTRNTDDPVLKRMRRYNIFTSFILIVSSIFWNIIHIKQTLTSRYNTYRYIKKPFQRIKIAINTLSVQGGGGVSNFLNLIPSLSKIDKINEYIIFISGRQRELLDVIPDGFQKVIIDYIPPSPYLRVVWEQIVFPFYLLYHKIDVFYSVGNITTLLAPCRVVLLMDNPTPYSPLNKGWTKKELLRIKLIKYLGWLSAKRADKVRFVSDNSKNILVKELNLPVAKCETIYHGCDINYIGAENNFHEDVKLRNNYILTVAIPAPYKNIHQLIMAFDVLVKKYNYHGNLVIVGDLFYSNYVKRLRHLVSELSLDERIIFTGKVEHIKIRDFYTHANLFVLPSVAETFGMPITEAMSCGVPVAVSDPNLSDLKGNHLVPFREICGDAAHYFNPFDPADIACGIYKIIDDDDYRENLKRRGLAQVGKYRWEETAKSMVRLFSDVMNTCQAYPCLHRTEPRKRQGLYR